MIRRCAAARCLLAGWTAATFTTSIAPLPESPSPQERFARDVLAAVAAADEPALRSLVRAAPSRATSLAHDLLAKAAKAGQEGSSPLSAARRIAEVARIETGSAAAAAAVSRFDALGAAGREERAALVDLVAEAIEHARGGRFSEAEEIAERALERTPSLSEPYLEGRCARLLGQIRKDLRRLPEARRDLERALAADERAEAALEVLSDLHLLGDVDFLLGDLPPALDRYRRALSLAEALGETARVPALLREIGAILSVLGDHEGASRALRRALAAAREITNPIAEADALGVLGSLESGRGRYGNSVRLLLYSAARWREAGHRRGEASALVLLGGVYSEVGLAAEAEASVDRALEILADTGPPAELGRALVARGLARIDAGRFEEALEPLEEARRLLEQAGERATVASALQHRGTALGGLGRPAEAESAFREARRLFEETGDSFGDALALTGLADSLLALGRLEEARDSYDLALERAATLWSHEASWRARAGLARLEERAGREDAALLATLAAIRDVEAIRGLLLAPSARQLYLGDKLDLYRRAALLLGRRGRLAESFRMAEAAKAWTLLEMAASRPVLEPAAGAMSGGPSARLHETEGNLRYLELQLASMPAGTTASAARADLENRLRRAREAHAAARLEAELADPRWMGLSGLVEPPSLTAIQGAIPEQAALVEFLVGRERSMAWVVRREEARFVELEASEASIRSRLDRIFRPIERLRAGATDVANLRFDSEAARDLHRDLIAPLRRDLEGCDLLWIVPDGPLRRAPFALFVTSREKRPVDPTLLYSQYAGCRFLVEDLAIGYLPAAGLLAIPRPADAARDAGAPALVVAAPSPLPSGAPPLAAAVAEAEAVRRRAEPDRVRILLGTEASEARVKREAAASGRIHIATHGTLDDERPAYSRLALAPGGGEDGWLHAYEVGASRLAAKLVVLSACESIGSAGRGEGLLGLSREFLAAGARAVVASAWVVDDEATALLMDRFHGALASGETSVRALRTAQVAVLREGRRPGLLLVHPFFWAGFLHVGVP